jgi:hypothetical protein
MDSMTIRRTGLPYMRRLVCRLKQSTQGIVKALAMRISVLVATETAGAAGFDLFTPLPSTSDAGYPSGSLQFRK